MKLPEIFSDNMVLQRDQAIVIWGKADPGEKITVEFCGHAKRTAADSKGNWKVLLPSLPASFEGKTLKIKARKSGEALEFNNVVIGDVFLAGGQSNMEWFLKDSLEGKQIYKSLSNSGIRSFGVPKYQGWENPRPSSTGWHETKGEQAAIISAVAYFFADEINRRISIPIGIVDCNLGAATCEAWINRDYLKKHETFQNLINEYNEAMKQYDVAAWLNYQSNVNSWYQIMQTKGIETAGPYPKDVPSPYSRRAAGNLYDQMLSTVIPFSIKGVLWYQGEANHHNADKYGDLFRVLIENWRSEFSQPNLPFFFVQLTSFWGFDEKGFDTPFWAEIREGQLHVSKTLPHTAMAVSIDMGERLEIHPARKQPIGLRLALLARKNLYGESGLITSGPVYKSNTIEGNKMRLFFENGNGFLNSEKTLATFEICGNDNVFQEAQAVIDGNTILVSSSKVSMPAAARYGWANWFEPSLFNDAGLPASPFRTD